MKKILEEKIKRKEIIKHLSKLDYDTEIKYSRKVINLIIPDDTGKFYPAEREQMIAEFIGYDNRAIIHKVYENNNKIKHHYSMKDSLGIKTKMHYTIEKKLPRVI